MHQLRQSTDTTAQQAALAKLNCGTDYSDPLLGNDDTSKPLVACDQPGQAKYILGPSFLDGTQISDATSGQNPNGAGFVVNLTLQERGLQAPGPSTPRRTSTSRPRSCWTPRSVSRRPSSEAIPGGNTQISGNFTQQQAADLANVLKYGSLPLAFDSSNAQTVSATLGLASLQAGLIAGGIGLRWSSSTACSTTGPSACSPCSRWACPA